MEWYSTLCWGLIVSQVFFVIEALRNFHYVMGRYSRKRLYRPKTVLIIPCKGLDRDFEKNISSFFRQNYEGFTLWFVVEGKDDPAYAKLLSLISRLSPTSLARAITVHVAGKSETNSQKIHNLLYCVDRVGSDIEVIAFADSDICVHKDWLSHLVFPVEHEKNGCATGYRWFIPTRNNFATLAMTAINGKISQWLGNSRFNQAWGGSMAIRVQLFKEIGLDKIWRTALSDDLTLTRVVKNAGKKVVFVPACLVPSYGSITFGKLFEFARRQFLITRVNSPGIWLFGLIGNLYSILGLWATAAVAFLTYSQGQGHWLYAAVPVVFVLGQLFRTILREVTISIVLGKTVPQNRFAKIVDVVFFWLWSPMLLFFILSSAFGNTITWRGIKYKLITPEKTVIVKQ